MTGQYTLRPSGTIDISRASDNLYNAYTKGKLELMSAPAGPNDGPHHLARFVTTLRERWWAVLFTIIVVGGLVFGVSLLLEPRYSATSQLTYSSRDAQLASQALSSSGNPELAHNISSDSLALTTSAFAGRVSKAMGGSVSAGDLRSSIDIASDPGPDVITIKAVGSDPIKVAEIADTFASEFVKLRQEGVEESLTEAKSFLDARIDSLTPEEASSELGIALKQQREGLALVISMQVTDYEILQKATVPTSPYFPRPFRMLLIGLGAGLLIGLIVASLLDYFDRRIKDQSTLERVMELPVLGTVPLVSRQKSSSSSIDKSAVGFAQGNDSLLESVQMLRSNLKVLGFGDTRRTVLITSTAPGEGKSRLAANLAIGMALSGDRVILVDADLRNPTIHKYLGIPNDQGLGDALMEREVSWSAKIQAVDLAPFASPRMGLAKKPGGKEVAISKFLCLPSGSLPSNPTEILESEALGDVLAELQGISDYVILDGPPMLVASDALVLAQSVDAVVLASTLGKETTAEAVQVRQLLARAEIAALGIVICGGKPQPPYRQSARDGKTSARKDS
jgi:Mrp family chromosome partitioning ATPase/capsular polysaccharide biosynthesis protein